MHPVLLTVAIFLLLIALRTFWIVRRFTHHPHLEPLTIAHPSIAPCIEAMVERICRLATIDTPPVYILRSQHPNAFVFSAFGERRLVLTDELLEEADQQTDGVDFLERIICHEIAHITLRHGPRLYLLKLLEQLIPIPLTRGMSEARLQRIETEADALAETLFRKLNTPH